MGSEFGHARFQPAAFFQPGTSTINKFYFLQPPEGQLDSDKFFVFGGPTMGKELGKMNQIWAGQGKFWVKKMDLSIIGSFGAFLQFRFLVPGSTPGRA